LRTKTLIFGLIIILVGILVISPYSEPRTDTRIKSITTSGENVNNSWDIYGNLTKDEVVTFTYRDGYNWTEGEFDISEDYAAEPVLWLFVNMTPVSPHGNTSTFLVQLRERDEPTTSGPGQRRLFIHNITMYNEGEIDTSSARDVNGNLIGVGGTIPFSGTYRANIWTIPPRVVPPSFLGFYHTINATDYPNTFLLPTGGVIVAFGGTLSFIGAKSVVQENLHRKTRKQRSK
jgi:hypothetical protein